MKPFSLVCWVVSGAMAATSRTIVSISFSRVLGLCMLGDLNLRVTLKNKRSLSNKFGDLEGQAISSHSEIKRPANGTD